MFNNYKDRSKVDPFAERQKEIEDRLSIDSWIKPNLGDTKYMREKFSDDRFIDQWSDNTIRSLKSEFVLRGWEDVHKAVVSNSSENRIVRTLTNSDKTYTIYSRYKNSSGGGLWWTRLILWADRDLTAVYNSIGSKLRVSQLETEADTALTAMAKAVEVAQKAVDALKLEKGK